MLWLAVVMSVAAIIAIVIAWGVLSVLPRWFEDNPRMVMRRIELTSRNRMSDRSYWNNHKNELIRRLELYGAPSLWASDSGELRRKLEDPKLFSSIQHARVYKELPDTLRIEITERTPVAFIRDSSLVVDESCMLIKRRETMVADRRKWREEVPDISGITPKETPGVQDMRLAPAVALIKEVDNKNGADIRMKIIEIVLQPPERMICRFRCGSAGPEYRAVFPIRHYEKKLGIQVLALRTALIRLREEGLDRRDFDLSFDGQVVIKGNKDGDDNNKPQKRETLRR
jgi:hypothetical protein